MRPPPLTPAELAIAIATELAKRLNVAEKDIEALADAVLRGVLQGFSNAAKDRIN